MKTRSRLEKRSYKFSPLMLLKKVYKADDITRIPYEGASCFCVLTFLFKFTLNHQADVIFFIFRIHIQFAFCVKNVVDNLHLQS